MPQLLSDVYNPGSGAPPRALIASSVSVYNARARIMNAAALGSATKGLICIGRAQVENKQQVHRNENAKVPIAKRVSKKDHSRPSDPSIPRIFIRKVAACAVTVADARDEPNEITLDENCSDTGPCSCAPG